MRSPKKSLGQHFLNDSFAQKISKVIDPQEDEVLIEVGSGRGALTRHLVKKAQVIAVEKDDDLSQTLKLPSLTVLHDDILTIDLKQITLDYPIRLVSNLPFYITSKFLGRFLPLDHFYKEIFLLVQHEITERLIAEPGSSKRGSLTVFSQAFADIEYLFQIPKNAYYPPPNVKSSVIKLSLKPFDHPCPNEFFDFVKQGFTQKRKKLLNALKAFYEKPQLEKAFEQAHLGQNCRAEELNCEQWKDLFQNLVLKKSVQTSFDS